MFSSILLLCLRSTFLYIMPLYCSVVHPAVHSVMYPVVHSVVYTVVHSVVYTVMHLAVSCAYFSLLLQPTPFVPTVVTSVQSQWLERTVLVASNWTVALLILGKRRAKDSAAHCLSTQ